MLLALSSGSFGGSEQGRNRESGRQVTFMEHLCAHNPPSSYAAESGFWFYMHKETEAQLGQAVSQDH